MNTKLKRAVAIIALVLILIFTVSLILYIFDSSMLNGAIGDLAMWSGGFGILLAAVLWVARVFPYQQIKDEERERIFKEAEEEELRLAEEEERKQKEQEQGETGKASQQEECQQDEQETLP